MGFYLWKLMITEGGSSGSALFDGNHRIIGQLFGFDVMDQNVPIQVLTSQHMEGCLVLNGAGTANTRLVGSFQ